MHALRLDRHGSPDELRWQTVPDPVAAPGEVLVRVRACALNHLDLFLRQGMPGVTVPLPRILGSDIAGEVVATAAGVSGALAPGARVLLAPGAGCGHCHFCLDGRDNECSGYQMLGFHRDGGYAELVAVPRRSLLPIPDGMDFVAAASFPLVFLTAWNMLVRRAQIQPGQTVLVWAAASGVGIAAIQIAKLFGCRVLATAAAEKADFARQLGADEVIDHYDPQRPVARALKALCPQGVDIVVEHVGQASWNQSLRALAPGGTLVTCGATTGYEAAIDLRFLFTRQLRLLGSYMGRRADLDTVVELAARGKLRAVVDRVFPLPEAAAAHRWLEEKRHRGKVVLESQP